MYRKYPVAVRGRLIWFLLCFGIAVVYGPISQGQSLIPQEATADQRFEILQEFEGEAILDHETQLIWERSPSRKGAGWTHAPMFCAMKSVGGRKGWRLPSFLELMTLVDFSVDTLTVGTALPIGHPFRGVKAESYWSINALSTNDQQAYAVDFLVGDVAAYGKSRIMNYWCVRGGQEPIAAPKSSTRWTEQL